MNRFDEEALQILPIYKRYEKQFKPHLPLVPRISIFLGTVVLGFGWWHHVTGIRPFAWEGLVFVGLLFLAATMFLVWGVVGLFYPKRKSPEAEMRERLSFDRECLGELGRCSAKSRHHFLKYIQHYWSVEEVRVKSWSAIILTLGGLASTLSEWTGHSKATYAFLAVAVTLAYISFLVNQIALAQTKRFGDLLEAQEDSE